MANATGIIYDPPRAGFPYLAAVFMDGKLLHCEPVASVAEGEAMLAEVMREMPEMVKKAQQGED
ncbi:MULTISPECIES: hypothetical protein [unclassified Mesorhizobium]|uniref:hypothetical protein n=1 Tax=unclassified Mesorhizobium TaxID=325217 RepID=UPI0018EDFA7E|nr:MULTISPECIES: hypothetical protein [unclassified Mesorhizobium]BCG83366.1 hypothetical protein MesoLj113b_69080 [Mesorhizobium sp. 113-3-3]BCH05105.1 hypothetical protein MesoLj131b_71040 [Mesorhizobium sp. 131-2-5]